MTIVVATRSEDKLREIRQILRPLLPVRLESLRERRVPYTPEEAEIEQFDTFADNAVAKARYFADRIGSPVLADDSGLCVDVLGGAPGVYSKRFARRPDLSGTELDQANNDLLLTRLAHTELWERSARYVCALAFVEPGVEPRVFSGACEGVILPAPRGSGGFGYDPLFRVASEACTFGELRAERKNQISHRARALQSFAAALRPELDELAEKR